MELHEIKQIKDQFDRLNYKIRLRDTSGFLDESQVLILTDWLTEQGFCRNSELEEAIMSFLVDTKILHYIMGFLKLPLTETTLKRLAIVKFEHICEGNNNCNVCGAEQVYVCLNCKTVYSKRPTPFRCTCNCCSFGRTSFFKIENKLNIK